MSWKDIGRVFKLKLIIGMFREGMERLGYIYIDI